MSYIRQHCLSVCRGKINTRTNMCSVAYVLCAASCREFSWKWLVDQGVRTDKYNTSASIVTSGSSEFLVFGWYIPPTSVRIPSAPLSAIPFITAMSFTLRAYISLLRLSCILLGRAFVASKQPPYFLQYIKRPRGNSRAYTALCRIGLEVCVS